MRRENRSRREQNDSGNQGFWPAALATLVSAFMSAGFAIHSLFVAGPGHLYALYGAARSLPLAATSLAMVLLRSRVGVATLALTVGLVQASDVIVGIVSGNLAKALGPAVLAAATLGALARMFRKVNAAN